MNPGSDEPTLPSGAIFNEVDLAYFMSLSGHTTWLGLKVHATSPDWIELALPWAPKLTVDHESGVLASGPLISLLDNTTAFAAYQRRREMALIVTVDLRIDYMRAAIPGRTVIARGECYKLTRSMAFVSGTAYDERLDDPIARATGTFMIVDGELA